MSSSPERGARVLVPFAIITLIWGSTWIVIVDQLGPVPPSWSVAYRFAVAAACMFAYAWATRTPLAIGLRGHLFAAAIGIPQFVLNFNFVYRAEQYVTSGLVAVCFATLFIVNAVLGRVFLGQKITLGFVAGSAVALGGIALLFVNEFRVMPTGARAVAVGLGLTVAGILSAAIANVMQASERARAMPMASMVAWAMLYGVVVDGVWAWIATGPPVFEARIGYWAGVVYLGAVASALAFTLYFGLIRAIGPARAAYSSVIVPIIAMGLSTAFEGYRWSGYAIAGAALAIAGLVVALVTRDGPRSPRPFGRGG